MIKLNLGTYSSTELSHEAYLSDLEHVSSHWLKTLVVDEKTPMHLQHYLSQPHHDTPALIMGRAIHTAILEPDMLAARYLTLDPEIEVMNKRSTAYKEARAQMLSVARESGAELVHSNVLEVALAVRDSAYQCETVRKIMSKGVSEHTLVYKDHERVSSKCRFDRIFNDQISLDLKSAQSAAPKAFRRSIINFGYDVQAAHYQTGASQEWDIDQYGWIVVESEPPYAVAFYVADPEILEFGYARRERGMNIIDHCRTHNDWPGYVDRFESIELPGYLRADS